MSPATTLPEFLSGLTLSNAPQLQGGATIQGQELRRTASSSRARAHWRDPRRAQRRGPGPSPVSLCVLALRYCRSFLTARSRTPFSLEASRWANWSSVDCMAGAIAPASASQGLRACRSPPSDLDCACALAAARG